LSLAHVIDEHHDAINAALDGARGGCPAALETLESTVRAHLVLVDLLAQELRRRAPQQPGLGHEPRARVLRDAVSEARRAGSPAEAARAILTVTWLVRDLRAFEEAALLPPVSCAFTSDELDHLARTRIAF